MTLSIPNSRLPSYVSPPQHCLRIIYLVFKNESILIAQASPRPREHRAVLGADVGGLSPKHHPYIR